MISYDTILKILWIHWNPIGIKRLNDQDDEYNGYARQIEKMICEGASYEDIFNYLKWASTENMGLSFFEKEKAIDTARTILSLR